MSGIEYCYKQQTIFGEFNAISIVLNFGNTIGEAVSAPAEEKAADDRYEKYELLFGYFFKEFTIHIFK
jgi:hypothetical protein